MQVVHESVDPWFVDSVRLPKLLNVIKPNWMTREQTLESRILNPQDPNQPFTCVKCLAFATLLHGLFHVLRVHRHRRDFRGEN